MYHICGALSIPPFFLCCEQITCYYGTSGTGRKLDCPCGATVTSVANTPGANGTITMNIFTVWTDQISLEKVNFLLSRPLYGAVEVEGALRLSRVETISSIQGKPTVVPKNDTYTTNLFRITITGDHFDPTASKNTVTLTTVGNNSTQSSTGGNHEHDVPITGKVVSVSDRRAGSNTRNLTYQPSNLAWFNGGTEDSPTILQVSPPHKNPARPFPRRVC